MLAKTTTTIEDPMMLAKEPEHRRAHAKDLASVKWGEDWSSNPRLSKMADAFARHRPVQEPVAVSRRSYLLQTAPQQEPAVRKALLDAGFDAYLPVEPKSVRVGHGERKIIQRPMLAGYMFPIFDEHRDNWQIIRKPKDGRDGIEGVVRLFLWGERPVPVPDHEVQRIRNVEIEKSMGKRRKLPPVPLQVGSLVQIIEHSSFGGWLGKVIGIAAEKWKATAELDVFGQKVPVTLSIDCLRVID